jgi:hypothetical protein
MTWQLASDVMFNCWVHALLTVPVSFLLLPIWWDRLEYSRTSLENSEFLFSSNFDGVSYSTILPAYQKLSQHGI